jgi:hypothetical protein
MSRSPRCPRPAVRLSCGTIVPILDGSQLSSERLSSHVTPRVVSRSMEFRPLSSARGGIGADADRSGTVSAGTGLRGELKKHRLRAYKTRKSLRSEASIKQLLHLIDFNRHSSINPTDRYIPTSQTPRWASNSLLSSPPPLASQAAPGGQASSPNTPRCLPNPANNTQA